MNCQVTQAQNVADLAMFAKTWRQDFTVFFGQRADFFDFCHDKANNLPVENGRDGVKLLSRGNVGIPSVWVFDWEPFPAQSFDFGQVPGIEESKKETFLNQITFYR